MPFLKSSRQRRWAVAASLLLVLLVALSFLPGIFFRGILSDQLEQRGLRAELDDRETLGYRIRKGEVDKIPYLAVVGEREAEAGTVAVRKRGADQKQEVMDRSAFVERLVGEVESRTLD